MNINQALKELSTEPERIEQDNHLSRAAKDRKIKAIETVTTLLKVFPTEKIDKEAEMIDLLKQLNILFVQSEKFQACKMNILREVIVEQKELVKSMADAMLIWFESFEK